MLHSPAPCRLQDGERTYHDIPGIVLADAPLQKWRLQKWRTTAHGVGSKGPEFPCRNISMFAKCSSFFTDVLARGAGGRIHHDIPRVRGRVNYLMMQPCLRSNVHAVERSVNMTLKINYHYTSTDGSDHPQSGRRRDSRGEPGILYHRDKTLL
jgi:hypothetical protein